MENTKKQRAASINLPQHYEPRGGILRIAAGDEQFALGQFLRDGVHQLPFAEQLKFHLPVPEVRHLDDAVLAHDHGFLLVQFRFERLAVHLEIVRPAKRRILELAGKIGADGF